MKKIILFLGLFILIDILYFSFANHGHSLALSYKPFIQSFSVPSGVFYLVYGLYGMIGGCLLTYYKSLSLEEKVKKLSRTAEKSSIQSEESTDKVKALEAKIVTLETALKEALNKK